MLCAKVANKFFYFFYLISSIHLTRKKKNRGGVYLTIAVATSTAGRLSLIKKQKDASEYKANFAASWAAELQDLLIQTKEQEEKDSQVLFIYKYIHVYGGDYKLVCNNICSSDH